MEHRILGLNVYYNDVDTDHDVLLSDTWNNTNAQFDRSLSEKIGDNMVYVVMLKNELFDNCDLE